MLRCGRGAVIGCALLAGGFPLPGQRDLKIETITAKHSFALVIGNNSYAGASLKNAINDARAMEKTLQELGFATDLLLDANSRAMRSGIDRFVSQISPGDVALFYYAGHGVQIDGENYLVPIDFDGHDEIDLKYQSLSASWIQEKLDQSGAQLKILIFDACRTNPFRRSRGGPGGLAQMQGGRGSFVAFATAAGKVANDNVEAQNGLFTQYLVKDLKEPGQTLDDVFNHVRGDVDRASGGQQLPYVYSGVVGQFYFRPVATAPVNPAPVNRTPIRITNAVLAREPTPSGLDPRLIEPETDFLTTDPHVVVIFTYMGGYKGDKIRGEWRNPFGGVTSHFDIEQGGDGGGYVYFWYLGIANGDPGRMPGNWELRLLWNDRGMAILPFRISVPPSSPVRLLNSTVLSRATANVAYRYQLRADGGTPPYHWSAIGNIPAGLTLSPIGLVTGAPARRGSFRVLIRVEDSAGNSITRTLGLGVGAAPQGVHVTVGTITKLPSSPDACASPAEATRFSTNDPSAWIVFSVDGDKVGDWAAIEWLGPSGEVQFSSSLERKADRQRCYPFKLPIAGTKAVGMPGNWSVRVLWLDGEILTIPFQIVD